MSARDPELAIVVPTRDRPEALSRCLAALAGQRGVSGFELIVVDDGSRDATAIARAVSAVSAARLVRLDGHGVAAARNAGVAASSAPIVCFTDDDCEPSAEWAATLARRIRSGCDAAGGATLNGRPDDPLVTASETIVAHLVSQSATAGARSSFVPGSNVACTRAVLERVSFDERYPYAGEDRDWCERLAAAGYRLEVEQAALVTHFPRATLGEFWRRHLRYGRGAHRFKREPGRRLSFEQPAFYARLLDGAFRQGAAVGLSVCIAQAATAIGFVAEAASLRRVSS